MMVIFMFMAVGVIGQSKKTIREKEIVSITVHEYFIEEGMDDPVVESVEKYDEAGEQIEIQEFNSV